MQQRGYLIVSLKEVYGWLSIAGLFLLLLLLLRESDIRPIHLPLRPQLTYY